MMETCGPLTHASAIRLVDGRLPAYISAAALNGYYNRTSNNRSPDLSRMGTTPIHGAAVPYPRNAIAFHQLHISIKQKKPDTRHPFDRKNNDAIQNPVLESHQHCWEAAPCLPQRRSP
ncbi:hypothetical protein KN198_25955 (plasmid) [Ralstonia solanacearum]|nr:hypothetical protein KN198_25955 [Ralstonia solanacearum]